MFLIQNLTNDPYQKHSLKLEDGSILSITLKFLPMQQGWFITELVCNDFIIRGMRICNSPNLLHPFLNNIDFGLSCYSVANREPSLVDDFSSALSKLYILTKEECREYLEFLQNG